MALGCVASSLSRLGFGAPSGTPELPFELENPTEEKTPGNGEDWGFRSQE